MKTILCFGDSNTFGCLPIDVDPLSTPFVASRYRYPKQKRWTSILQTGLGDEYDVIVEGLNGRTTIFDEPTRGPRLNGGKYLLPCLESHNPIDLVILMLGTNDLKTIYAASAYEIAKGIALLVSIIQSSGCGPDGSKPKILILCPPPIGKMTIFKEVYDEQSVKKSKDLTKYYKKVADLFRCDFFDVGDIIKPSSIDGLHYHEKEIEKLGKTLIKIVKNII